MPENSKVIALGFFDGVHVGHAELLKAVRSVSEEKGLSPAVMSFDVHPDNLVFQKEVGLIFDSRERVRIIQSLFQIDDTILLRFTEDLMKMEWNEFLDLLIDKFNAKWLVVGYDFTFGHHGTGTVEKLKEYCTANEIGCTVVPPVYVNNEVVSSTKIRELISEGNVEKANQLLGHPYYISGTVVQGLHNGKKLGFPTLNIKMPVGNVVPHRGVYASKVALNDGRVFCSATDVGVKPTVCDDDTLLIESHLLDFSEMLYGREISIYLLSFIRPEQQFSSFAELSNAIRNDVQQVRKFFNI